jgi:hypothetical protein
MAGATSAVGYKQTVRGHRLEPALEPAGNTDSNRMKSSADVRSSFPLRRDALFHSSAVRVADHARGKFCTELLDLAPGATSIIDQNDATPHQHHWFLLEHRLSIAEAACGEKHSQGR